MTVFKAYYLVILCVFNSYDILNIFHNDPLRRLNRFGGHVCSSCPAVLSTTAIALSLGP